jgi:hypothetical protein
VLEIDHVRRLVRRVLAHVDSLQERRSSSATSARSYNVSSRALRPGSA